jgi:hypothetical protein
MNLLSGREESERRGKGVPKRTCKRFFVQYNLEAGDAFI